MIIPSIRSSKVFRKCWIFLLILIILTHVQNPHKKDNHTKAIIINGCGKQYKVVLYIDKRILKNRRMKYISFVYHRLCLCSWFKFFFAHELSVKLLYTGEMYTLLLHQSLVVVQKKYILFWFSFVHIIISKSVF